MTTLLQLLLQGVMVGGVYALVALGFVIIYKSSRVLNLAQGEFMLLGAYIAWTFLTGLHLPMALAFPATVVFALLLGLAVERLALRPMIGEPLVAVIMMTIGLMFLFRGVAVLFWGGPVKTFEPSLFPTRAVPVGNLTISQEHLWSFILALVLFGGFAVFFRYTTLGLAMRATAEDEQAAQSTGIGVRRVYAVAWSIAALVAAAGGTLLGSIMGISAFLSEVGLKTLTVPLVGGLESIMGVAVAGPLIGIAENLAGGYLDPIMGGGVKEVAPFVVLIIILLIKPYGLFGLKRIERI